MAQPDPKTKQIPLVDFLAELQSVKDESGVALYQDVHVFEMDPHIWINMGRPRICHRACTASS